jgi:AAA+ ATPase superfamily predicted ATPase
MTKAGQPAGSPEQLGNENPFPGLRYFQESESPFFVGRDKEISELVRRIKRAPLTVLFGISGLGKTSLLLAGAFPQLREDAFFPVRLRLSFYEATESFAEQVVTQVRQEAAAQGIEAGERLPGESLWEYFHRVDFWDQRNQRLQPVLVFDQFEETFTLGREHRDERVQPFSAELADLIENRVPVKDRRRISKIENLPYSISEQRYRVVLSLREDYLAELESWQQLIPSLSSNRMRLRPMNGEAAMRVVTQVPGQVSNPVAEQIVRFVANDTRAELAQFAELEIEPSLLSVVCRELNNRRTKAGLDSITQDLLHGNRELILERLYDDCLEHFGEYHDAIRKLVEEQLLTTSGLRDSVAVEDILNEQTGITEDNLAILIDQRLVRIEERAGVRRMELSHDLWTQSIVRSRDERRHTEEIEAREQARRAELEERERQRREALEAEKAETEARNQKLERSRRQRTKMLTVSLLAGLAMLVALVYTVDLYRKAETATKKAETAANEAEQARKKAADAFGNAQLAKQEAAGHLAKLQSAARDYAPVTIALKNLRDDIEADRPASEVANSLDYLDEIIRDYSESVGAADDPEANIASVDDLFIDLGKDDAVTREAALKQLIRLHNGESETVQKALLILQPPTKLDSPQAQSTLQYLNQAVLATWTGELVQQALQVLEDSPNEFAQRVRARVYLAAINNLDRADQYKLLKKMTTSYGDSALQINVALDQVKARGVLSPNGRYNTFDFLADSSKKHRSAWNQELANYGCKVAKAHLGKVGPSTQDLVVAMRENLGCR